MLYAGDLSSVRAWLEPFPLNTDDSPVVEFMAPVSQSRKEMVSGPALISFYRRIQESPAANPVRVRPINGSEEAVLSPLAGNLLFVAMEARGEKDDKTRLALINRATELLPGSNVLNLMNVVLNATSATATRGVALDSLK